MRQEEVREARQCLLLLLAQLGHRDRILLIEKYLNNSSDEEIAAILETNSRYIRVYLARARRRAAFYYGEGIDAEKNKQHKKAGKEKDKEGEGGAAAP